MNKQATAQGFLSRQGQQFYLNGAPTRLLGVNRYQLGGGPGAAQCQQKSSMHDLAAYQDRFIREAAAHGAGLIRMWAFQNFAGPSGSDFSALDQAVATARRHGVRLILTLENTWGDCSKPGGTAKDAAWFAGGYRHPYGYALDFPSYVQRIVSRYKDEPTIAMWQIINEGKWYQDPRVLRDFLVATARQIKSIDRNHLVSSGGAIQCWQGAQGAADFASYYDDDAIDVLDAHDYDTDTVPWSGCMDSALQAAHRLNKPLLIGESGIDTRKHSADERARLLAAKMHAAAGRHVAGYLIWSLSLDQTGDGFDFFPGDPTSVAYKHAGAEWSGRPPGTSHPAPAPAPAPQPSPAPSPGSAQGACSYRVAPAATWRTGANTWEAAVNLDVMQKGPRILGPWKVNIGIRSLTAFTQVWNWKLGSVANSVATGTVLDAFETNSYRNIGGIVALTQDTVDINRLSINGIACARQ